MIQGGDISLSSNASPSLPFSIPKGGASIYHPAPLEQEIHLPTLRHNSRGILSMASKAVKKPTVGGGIETQEVNGSQFFLTFAPAPHLDGKSTVFGKVLGMVSGEAEGEDTLTKLERAAVKVDRKGRVVHGCEGEEEPWEIIGVENVTVHANPFAG